MRSISLVIVIGEISSIMPGARIGLIVAMPPVR